MNVSHVSLRPRALSTKHQAPCIKHLAPSNYHQAIAPSENTHSQPDDTTSVHTTPSTSHQESTTANQRQAPSGKTRWAAAWRGRVEKCSAGPLSGPRRTLSPPRQRHQQHDTTTEHQAPRIKHLMPHDYSMLHSPPSTCYQHTRQTVSTSAVRLGRAGLCRAGPFGPA